MGCRGSLRLFRAALQHEGEQCPDRAHADDEPKAGKLRPGQVLHEPHDVGAQEAAAEANGVDEGDAAGQGCASQARGGVGEEDELPI